ncbi:Bifunctional protein HldE [Sedimentisphaera cyanobacteriorum]|uniref:Bifunctional protein HldE n=1 Tax=Sedimentisphaera cyanobacteriorum TaxID=1940790 RepID=A0A1Q2HM66_9BACT|nr:D-glycero-beta-D-manno-heptose 1-phosphate adenylyltransferase [Sedimentisphaera cyanobacteriorum]AQQ08619.1 Bifunctional protein HldE [Sedimentisphaera cyanobacteriorum]
MSSADKRILTDIYEKLLSLSSPKVLLVGDFMLDKYTHGDALRISPEAPVPVLKVVHTEYKCGGAASVAADICELGAEPLCIGITGQDEHGRLLRDKLRALGADTSALAESPARPTTCKNRLVGLAQHKHPQQLMRIDEESSEELAEEEEQNILSNFSSKLPEADIVCLEDYNKGVLTENVCRRIIEAARNSGKMVVVDPPMGRDYQKFAGSTVITPNRNEARLISGIEIDSPESAGKAAEAIRSWLDIDAVVITMDKDGAYLKTADCSMLVPTVPKTVYDVAGAGDMVLSAIAVALAAGWRYEIAVHLSNIAGGLEVEKFGVASVSTAEILEEIKKRIFPGESKIVKMADISELCERLRIEGKRIVFTNGCFDIIHEGHINFLGFAKSQGDVLVLGLNSDASVKRLKGEDRPVNAENARAAVLSSLECVDYVCIFDSDSPLEIIKAVRPDVLVKGKDWEKKGVIGSEFVKANGGEVVLADLVEGISSTAIINKVKGKSF